MARKLIGVLMITNAFGSLSCALSNPRCSTSPRQHPTNSGHLGILLVSAGGR